MSSVYENFAVLMQDEAEKWPTVESRLEADPGSGAAFREVAEKALLRVIARDARLEARFHPDTSVGVIHGVNLMAGLSHIGAKLAKQEGFDEYDAEEILRHPRTFDVFSALAPLHFEIAGEVEYECGLKTASFSATAGSEFEIRDGALVCPSEGQKILSNCVRFYSAPEHTAKEHTENRGCPAGKAEMLQPIFGSVITICTKDPSLIPAIFGLAREVTPIKSQQGTFSVSEYISSVLPEQE